MRFGFGAGVDPRHHAAFEERFGFPLLEAWAMTETGAAACIMAHREPRHVGTRCFGRADFFVETRIVDEKRRRHRASTFPASCSCAPPAPTRARDFFLGYLKDEMATEAAWAGDWFHTGDVVRRSAEGDFHFVDRRKNVIRRSGENISAVEVESVLDTSIRRWPRAPSPRRPTRCAATRCSPASSCARRPTCRRRRSIAASIVRHALARLAYFKAPGYVAFVDALPLTVVAEGAARRAARARQAAARQPAVPRHARC